MTVTIKDIARKLGVSATAVSKALNDRDDISDKLKKEVQKAVEELDYSTNTIAQRLVKRKSNTIGTFILSREDAFNNEYNFGPLFISGILDEANNNGYDILLFSTNSDLLNKKSYIKLCKERQVEGAIFTGLRLDDPHLEEIQNASFPISIIDTYLTGENVTYVSTDNEKGIEMALDYLWKLGHRRIAIVNGHQYAQVSQIRLKKYKNYMRKKGFFDSDLIFTGDFSINSGYKCGLEITETKKLPTAIFVISDVMAFGVMKALKEKNYRLPEDISIIGFDNVTMSNFVTPRLTTIGQNSFKMGCEAVKLILDKLENKKVNPRILEPQLIIRDSCTKIKSS